ENVSTEASPPSDAAAPPAPSRRRWGRIAAITVALLIVLPLALIAVAAMLLPTEVIARAASERAEGALGVPVVISDLELKFWPSPSVALLDARLGSETSPVARVDRILLRPRLVPLLRGQVTVREITIDRPDVF